MKILQVVPALNAGGVERTTIEIAQALCEKNHIAHVCSAGGRLEGELAAADGILHRLPLGAKNPVKMRRNTRALIKVIKSEGIDIVHARSRAPAWSAHAAARYCGVPFMTTYHGIYNANSKLKRRYNAIMAKGDIVIANSQFTKDHISATHGLSSDDIVVIHRGVDMQRFDPARVTAPQIAAQRKTWGVPDQAVCLLLPGRLTSWKGQAVAIKALAALNNPAAYLVLLGDAQGRDDYVTELDVLAQQRGVRARVIFAGHSADMPIALSACDMALSCSTDPEAFGRISAEAQAMGKWIIASAHGGSLENISDGVTGALIAPADEIALARAIETGASAKFSPEGSRARIFAQFSAALMKQKTLAVYAQLYEPQTRQA